MGLLPWKYAPINPVELISPGLLLILVIALFGPVLTVVVPQPIDYGLRIMFAQAVYDGSPEVSVPVQLYTPHALDEQLFILVYRLLPGIRLIQAAFIVALALYVLLALVIFSLLCMYLGRPSTLWTGAVYLLSTLLMMLVTPITLFTPCNQYFGYIAIRVYHSPTMALLQPFAVVLFYLALRLFDAHPVRHPRNWWYLCSLVSVLCALAKPSYAVVILPALTLMTGYRLWKRCSFNRMLLVAGILCPLGLVLGLQAVGYDQSLALAPLAVFNAWASLYNPSASTGLLLKLTLSILFPLVVYVSYFNRARHNLSLNLAWLAFGFGAGYTYLLAESNRVAHGNLTWSGQIALFILFLSSLIFFLAQNRVFVLGREPFVLTPAFVIGISILALHLVSGIVWYRAHLSVPVQDMQWNLW